MNKFTTQEKIEEIEDLIIAGLRDNRSVGILKEIATDLRGRLDHAPNLALTEMTGHINNVMRSKTPTGYAPGPLAALGQYVTGRWGLIQQALERFGAEIEGKS